MTVESAMARLGTLSSMQDVQQLELLERLLKELRQRKLTKEECVALLNLSSGFQKTMLSASSHQSSIYLKRKTGTRHCLSSQCAACQTNSISQWSFALSTVVSAMSAISGWKDYCKALLIARTYYLRQSNGPLNFWRTFEREGSIEGNAVRRYWVPMSDVM